MLVVTKKTEPNAWEGGKGSCAVCIDLLAMRVLGWGSGVGKLILGA